MILSIVKYFKGGLSYEYLSNAPISEVIDKNEKAQRINAEENKAAKK